MLSLNVTVQGDKVVIAGLQKIGSGIEKAKDRALVSVAKGIHRDAFDWLSGAGAKATGVQAGGYPVPVRTGHLRGHLDWLMPGASKTGPAGTFSAGRNEVVIYDSALYSRVIHEGLGSSAKFGPRRYLTDALARFNQGERIMRIFEEEIQVEIAKGG